MPTYEYHCAKCKSTYDLRQGFDAESTHTCEHCGKGTARRILHAPRVVFKGSGFYVTDSKNKGAAVAESDNALTKTETDAAPAETASDAKKSEPKSAPKKTDSSAGSAAAAS